MLASWSSPTARSLSNICSVCHDAFNHRCLIITPRTATSTSPCWSCKSVSCIYTHGRHTHLEAGAVRNDPHCASSFVHSHKPHIPTPNNPATHHQVVKWGVSLSNWLQIVLPDAATKERRFPFFFKSQLFNHTRKPRRLLRRGNCWFGSPRGCFWRGQIGSQLGRLREKKCSVQTERRQQAAHLWAPSPFKRSMGGCSC